MPQKKICPPKKGFLAPKMRFFTPEMEFKSIIYFKTLFKVRNLVEYPTYDVLWSRNTEKKICPPQKRLFSPEKRSFEPWNGILRHNLGQILLGRPIWCMSTNIPIVHCYPHIHTLFQSALLLFKLAQLYWLISKKLMSLTLK